MRELAVRGLRFGTVSRLLDALSHLEQVPGQVAVSDVEAEPLDQAVTRDDRAAVLPERASLARAGLAAAVGEVERAELRLDLVHGSSVRLAPNRSIGSGTDPRAAFYGGARAASLQRFPLRDSPRQRAGPPSGRVRRASAAKGAPPAARRRR